MLRRKRLSRGKSRRMFSRGANRIHRKNDLGANVVMRGGIRL